MAESSATYTLLMSFRLIKCSLPSSWGIVIVVGVWGAYDPVGRFSGRQLDDVRFILLGDRFVGHQGRAILAVGARLRSTTMSPTFGY